MKTLIALLLLSSTPAFADITLGGKIYTCIEGTAACTCKQNASGYVSVFFGDIEMHNTSSQGAYGVRSCREWIKSSPDVCN